MGGDDHQVARLRVTAVHKKTHYRSGKHWSWNKVLMHDGSLQNVYLRLVRKIPSEGNKQERGGWDMVKKFFWDLVRIHVLSQVLRRIFQRNVCSFSGLVDSRKDNLENELSDVSFGRGVLGSL